MISDTEEVLAAYIFSPTGNDVSALSSDTFHYCYVSVSFRSFSIYNWETSCIVLRFVVHGKLYSKPAHFGVRSVQRSILVFD